MSVWRENLGVTGGWGGEKTPTPHFWDAGGIGVSHRGALQAEHLRGATLGLRGRCEGRWDSSPQFWGSGCDTGEHCELSAREGRCTPGVCQNGGTCLNLLVGGFRCQCPPGHYEKPFCTMSTRSFPPHSFLTFRGLRQRFHFTLGLT